MMCHIVFYYYNRSAWGLNIPKNWAKIFQIKLENGVEGVVLETHKNWVNGDPLQSIQMSSKFMKEHFRQENKKRRYRTKNQQRP